MIDFFLPFLFGLIVGSFLNCVIYRLETGQSFLRGRSYCPACKHILAWQDLIPVFSFLALKGKCRYCHQKISWQYPLVEITTGLLFVSIFNQFSTCPAPNLFWCGVSNFPNFLTTIYLLLTTCFLIIIFVYDLKHYIIPDKVIYPAIIIALIFNLSAFGGEIFGRAEHFQFSIFNQFSICPPLAEKSSAEPNIFKFSILSAVGAAVFFLIIVLISRGKWMGVGDIKLVFLMGLILGFPNILVALFLAFILGAIIGIGLILSGKKNLKSEVPFGPFLVTGTFMAIFWGEKVVNWYLNFFL